MSDDKLKKITIVLNNESVKRVNYISTITEETNKTRCIAIALKIAEEILKQQIRGNELRIVKPDGSEITIKLMFG